MEHPSDTRYVLARPSCELCSAPYRAVTATLEVQTGIGGATARLCADCAAPFLSFAPVVELVPAADAVPLITGADADAYVSGQRWTVARTVPDDPHEYLLLRASTDQWMHLRFLRFVKYAGERRQWPRDRRWYSYWRSAGFEYWPMPGESETLINRRVVVGP